MRIPDSANLLLKCAGFIFVAQCALFAAEKKIRPEKDEEYTASGHSESVFLTGAGIMIEAELNGANESGFTGAYRKSLDMHFIRYGNLSMNMLVNEETITSKSGSFRFYPYRIRYEMDYIYLSYHFENSTIGLLFDHICRNFIDRSEDSIPEQLRWYGIGIRWESIAMKTGQKDTDINFNAQESFTFLNNFHYSLYACYSLSTREFHYDAIFRGGLRWDILRFYNMVSYTELNLQALVDDRVRVDRRFEAGLRFRLAETSLVSYASYSYIHDIDLYNGIDEGFWSAGMRLEAFLGEPYTLRGSDPYISEEGSDPSDAGRYTQQHETLRLNFTGGYARYMSSDLKNTFMESAATLYLPAYGQNRFFLTTDMNYSTCGTGSNRLYPRYMHYSFGGGTEFYPASAAYLAFTLTHESRHDGNEDRESREHYYLTGVTLSSEGKRRGVADRSLHRGDNKLISAINWKLFAGYSPEKKDYPYNREYRLNLRWDIARFRGAVAYTSPELRIMDGEISGTEYAFESGIRFGSHLAFILYHRFQKQIDIDMIGGETDRHHMIGLRAGNWL